MIVNKIKLIIKWLLARGPLFIVIWLLWIYSGYLLALTFKPMRVIGITWSTFWINPLTPSIVPAAIITSYINKIIKKLKLNRKLIDEGNNNDN